MKEKKKGNTIKAIFSRTLRKTTIAFSMSKWIDIIVRNFIPIGRNLKSKCSLGVVCVIAKWIQKDCGQMNIILYSHPSSIPTPNSKIAFLCISLCFLYNFSRNLKVHVNNFSIFSEFYSS
jgi:membrane-bound acyltransferase YfiQ involved in biofilm formation